jgi:HAD superfamily hydrolase (TIGR01509 family)
LGQWWEVPPEIRGIAFDLDGVLIHSTPIHAWAFQEVLRPLGIHDFVYEQWAGMATSEVMDRVLAEHGIEMDEAGRAGLTARKSALARDRMKQKPPIPEGCTDLLRKLSERFSLGLASAASPSSIAQFLELSQSRHLFNVVLSSEDVPRRKPAPDVYALAASRLNLSPSQMIVVEDAIAGVKAGCEAGAAVWAVLGTASAEELRSAGALYVYNGVLELGNAILNESRRTELR